MKSCTQLEESRGVEKDRVTWLTTGSKTRADRIHKHSRKRWPKCLAFTQKLLNCRLNCNNCYWYWLTSFEDLPLFVFRLPADCVLLFSSILPCGESDSPCVLWSQADTSGEAQFWIYFKTWIHVFITPGSFRPCQVHVRVTGDFPCGYTEPWQCHGKILQT